MSLGAWFIGLDVQHIDDRRLCCGTPPGKAYFCCITVLLVTRWIPSGHFLQCDLYKSPKFS